MIPLLACDPEAPFPPIEAALDNPRGLLAMGGDLSPARLVNAYCCGIFPWYSTGQPILWWAPFPRCVLYPTDVHVSRRLRRQYNQGNFRLTLDRSFERVITACAAPRASGDGTWITTDMQAAYVHLHEMGIAHSLEVWRDDELAGGIYGLALGGVFFGESMFSKQSNASKVALVGLCQHLRSCRFSLMDCQISNPHLMSMGCIDMPRMEFQQHLQAIDAGDHWDSNLQCVSRW